MINYVIDGVIVSVFVSHLHYMIKYKMCEELFTCNGVNDDDDYDDDDDLFNIISLPQAERFP